MNVAGSDTEKWSEEFRRCLERHNAPPGLASRMLRQVRTATRDSNRDAEELFGPAPEYARLVAEEHVSEDRRGAIDLFGRTPGALFRRNTYAVLEFAAVSLFARWVLFDRSDHELSMRLLLGHLLLGLGAIMLFAVFPALRASGRTRAGWLTAGAAVAAIALAVVGAGTLPAAPFMRVPALLTVGSIVALDVLARLVPETLTDRWFAIDSHGLDNETWLRRLKSLLRGRHGVPIRSSEVQVAETRAHLNASGNSAEDELGSVEVYALSLAAGSSLKQRKARRTIALNTVASVVALYFLLDSAFSPQFSLPMVGLMLACLAFLTFYSIVLWRQK